MKKILSSFLIALTLSTFVPMKKAEAGIAIAAFGLATATLSDVHDEPAAWMFFGVTAGIGGVVAWGGYRIMKMANGNPWGKAAGITLIVLDQKNNYEELSVIFPFLNNQEVVQALSKAINQQLPTDPSNDGLTLITLLEKEVRAILAPIDLSQDEILKVVSEFK